MSDVLTTQIANFVQEVVRAMGVALTVTTTEIDEGT